MKHRFSFKMLFAWLLVIVPLGWGIYKSIDKSRPLFSGNHRPADSLEKR